MKILLILSLFSPLVFTAQLSVGKAQFLTTEDDSISFIKEELKQRAFKDLITKEFGKIGLNEKAFWNKYNEILNTKTEEVRKSLGQKYRIETGASQIDIKNFKRVFRKRKLVLAQKLGSLDRVITTYVIRRNSRSSANPKLRLMTLEGKVNSQLLNKIYYKYVHGKKEVGEGRLYLDINYDLKKMDFTDLGISNDSDFIDVVNEYWVKWFRDNLPQNISEVIVVDSSIKEDLDSYFKIPKENLALEIPSEFRNSLLLNISAVILNKKMNKEKFEYSFHFSGGMYLMNLQTSKVITSKSLEKSMKDYRLSTNDGLSSLVANHVYRIPLPYFPGIKRIIKDLNPASKITSLRILDAKNTKQLQSLKRLLISRLVKYSVSLEVDSFSRGVAVLNLVYDGDRTELIRSIESLKSAKNDVLFDVIESDRLIGIKLK